MQLKSLVSEFREKISSIDATLIALCGIVVIAGIIRFYNIAQVGLRYYDEGYALIDARTFLQGGRIGSKPLHVLLISFAFRIFGVNDYVAVSVSAFIGTITIFLLFLIGKELYNKNLGLLASAMLAVTGSHIFYSKSALAYADLIFFMLLSFFFFIKGIRTYEDSSTLNPSYKLSFSPMFKLNISRSTLFFVLGGIFAGLSATITLLGLLLVPCFIFVILILTILKMIETKKGLQLIIVFIVTSFLTFFLIFGFLYLIDRLAISTGIDYYYTTRIRSEWSTPSTLIYYFIYLRELINPIFIFLALLGIVAVIKKKKTFDIVLISSIAFFLVFFSVIPLKHVHPRTYVISVPFLILLAARGVFIDLPKNFKRIDLQKLKTLIPLALILMSLGIFSSIDTLSVESPAYKEASDFLIEDNCRKGFTTATQILEFYTDCKWDWLKSKDQIFSVYSDGYTHIVIDYMYYHTGYEIAREILEKCTPVYVIKNNIAVNKLTLLETFDMQTVQEMLEDPYIQYVYVYRIENVIPILG